MADEFKRQMDARCRPGGLKCGCCNPHMIGDKEKLRRIARRQLGRRHRQEVIEEVATTFLDE